MYDKEFINHRVDEMFLDIMKQVKDIVGSMNSYESATSSIVSLVSSKLTSRSKTLLSSLYTQMSDNLLERSDYKESIQKQNRFYEANLEQEILKKYSFRMNDLKQYTKGVDYKEVNEAFTLISTTVGTLAAGTILSFALHNKIILPVAIVLAGGIDAFIHSSVPKKNKAAYLQAIESYLNQLKREFLLWFDEINQYFEERTKEL